LAGYSCFTFRETEQQVPTTSTSKMAQHAKSGHGPQAKFTEVSLLGHRNNTYQHGSLLILPWQYKATPNCLYESNQRFKISSIIASYVLKDLPLHRVSSVHMNYFEDAQ